MEPVSPSVKYRDVFAVLCLVQGKWRRIGSVYFNQDTAELWRSFKRKAVYATRSKVVKIRIELDGNGRPTEAAKQMMSDKYDVELT